jgi:hypothetical protein
MSEPVVPGVKLMRGYCALVFVGVHASRITVGENVRRRTARLETDVVEIQNLVARHSVHHRAQSD